MASSFPAVAQSPTPGRFNTTKSISTRRSARPKTAPETYTDRPASPNDMKLKPVLGIWTGDRADPQSPTSPSQLSPPLRSPSPGRATRWTSTANSPSTATGTPGNGSVPPTPKKQRMSLLVTASDALFSFGGRRASILRKQPIKPVHEPDDLPIVDIRPMNVEPTDEEVEREALRNEAAKSVGLVPPPIVERTSLPESPEEDDPKSPTDNSLDSAQVIRRASLPLSGSLSPTIDHATFSPNLASIRSAGSSMVSLSTETTTPPSGLSLKIPGFPATISSLSPFIQTSSTLLKHYAGGSFFLGKSRQWKSRHLVLTSLKPPPPANDPTRDMDTQAHLHLFRSSATEEKELERMRIDEDSVVFVVDEGPDVAGRKFVIKIGGLYAGGVTSTKDQRRKPLTSITTLSVVSQPSMAVSLGEPQDTKVLWLVQCPDTETMQRWIASVKAALLVQRAERAGLGMSIQSPDLRLTGDLDVLLSLRAQGLLQPPTPQLSSMSGPPMSSGPTSAPATMQSPSTPSPPTDDAPLQAARSGRARSSTTANPSGAVHALKGLFSASVLSNGGASSTTRPRSFSASNSSSNSPISTPASPLVTMASAMELAEDPRNLSLGTRASALLSLTLQRSVNESTIPSSSSLLLNQPISASVSVQEEAQGAECESIRERWERQRTDKTHPTFERPMSTSSLPPPPRAKRNGGTTAPPRSPIMEKSLQEELQQAMLATPSDWSGRRSSAGTVPEDRLTPMTGHDPSSRTSLEFQTRSSSDSADVIRASVDRAIPFPAPDASVNNLPSTGRTSPAPAVDPAVVQAARPGSALSSVSTTSLFVITNVTTPDRAQSPVSANASPLTRSSSSPKRSRRLPKMLAPPSGPPPSAPPMALALTPKGEQKALLPDDAAVSTSGSSGKDRNSVGQSFFESAKRVSTSSTGFSIRSFTSGSSSSRSNSAIAQRQSTVSGASSRSVSHPSPRPPPTFAPPPAPFSPYENIQSSFWGTEPLYTHPYASEASYSPSSGSGQRSSIFSNSSVSPVRSDFNVRLHRLTPPSAPPPTAALPPRPDVIDIAHHRPSSAHRRSNSLSATHGSFLSTIPASPVHRGDDLPAAHGGSPKPPVRMHSSPPSMQPSLPVPAPTPVTRHSSFKARLRMMSSPSPRSPTQPLPAIPNGSSDMLTASPKVVEMVISDGRYPNDPVDPVLPRTPDAIDRPIAPLQDAALVLPPIPPRSQARPRSPRVSQNPEVTQRTLSPPPRRGSRQSRELVVCPIPKIIADHSVMSTSERAGEEWEPSIRESVLLL
ncbi:hypothetical protein FRB99_005349 [Tulasnella sp. 403]|nr:hypothetical protein FRB99_005349 [Tulasnella sp. 403]